MTLVVIEYLIMILIISFAITIKFKFHNENSILITFLVTILGIYFLGLLNIMKIAIYIILLLDLISLVYIIYEMIKKKVVWEEVFSIGTVVYIGVCIILSIILKNTCFTEWDEFSHWGPNLKAMVANDLLWSNNKWDGIHVVYQPLAGIIEYLFCKINNKFSEDIAYIAINIGICTLMLPLLRKLKYNVKDIIISILSVFILYLSIHFFNFRLTSIYIDLLLAIFFSIGIYFAYQHEKLEEKILLLLVVISMVLLKTTGIFFDGIILMILFFKEICIPFIDTRKLSKDIRKATLKIVFIGIGIIAVYMSWKVYCNANNRVLDKRHDNNFISEINIKEYIKAIIQYKCEDVKLRSISKSFYEALNTKEIISGFPVYSCIQILVLFDIILILIYVRNNSRQIAILGASFNIGFLLYCLLLMATYMFAFTEQEGLSLASFERYMRTYFIAWFVNIVIIITNNQNKSLYKIGIISLICLYGSNIQMIIHPVTVNNSTIPAYIQEKANIITSSLTVDDKVFVIFQDPGYSVNPFVFRYCISPIVMNLMDEYSLGELKSADDTLTYNITEEEWEKKLIDENYDYVFILKSSNDFVEQYQDAFENGTDFDDLENRLFKIEKIDQNKVKLVLYK